MLHCDPHRCFYLFVSRDCPSNCSLSYHISFFRYHIYRQNQNRLNNNNTTRVNLNNVNRPPADADVPSQQPENAENNEENPQPEVESEITTQNVEPPVPVLEVVKTFLVSFVASIIPTDPAI